MTERRHNEDGEREGQFADEQARKPGRDPDRPEGDYGRGQEILEEDHEGTFAEGIGEKLPHPEDTSHGDFAEGMERHDERDRRD